MIRNSEASTSFDPQALTSLTLADSVMDSVENGFDPQALTSLTLAEAAVDGVGEVSIHRLLRA